MTVWRGLLAGRILVVAFIFFSTVPAGAQQALPHRIDGLFDQAGNERDPQKLAELESQALAALSGATDAALVASTYCRLTTLRMLRDEAAAAFSAARDGVDAIANFPPPANGEDVCLLEFLASNLNTAQQRPLAVQFARRAGQRYLAAEKRPGVYQVNLSGLLSQLAMWTNDNELQTLGWQVLHAAPKRIDDKPPPPMPAPVSPDQQEKDVAALAGILIKEMEKSLADSDAMIDDLRRSLRQDVLSPEDRAEREVDLRRNEVVTAQVHITTAMMLENSGNMNLVRAHLRRGLLIWDQMDAPDTVVVAVAREMLMRVELKRGDVKAAEDATLAAMRVIDERSRRVGAGADDANKMLARTAVSLAWEWAH